MGRGKKPPGSRSGEKNIMNMLTVLGDEGVRTIDAAARSILGRTGVEIPHEDALALFRRAGAAVDPAGGRVRIPSGLIDDCLASAKKSFTLYGRDRSLRAPFGAGRRNYNSTAGQALWIESSGIRRYCRLEDVGRAARLGDSLRYINIVGAMADPHEIDPAYRCVEVAAVLFRETTKPVMFWFNDRSAAVYVVELIQAITNGEAAAYPPVYPFLEPISPLRFARAGLDVLFETCKVPLPVPVGPMAQMGMSAPATVAATLAQETAEILAGVCAVQLIGPGTPVCFGGIPHAFDMSTAQIIFGGPEQGLMAVAMTEMGRHYGLPVYINVGLTDSKSVDAQAGLEIGASLLAGSLAGADIFGHLGIAGADQGASPEMLVFQHEAIGYLERMLRPIDISDETLALDLIDSAGPHGSFIAEEHTVLNFRRELWMPRIFNRQYYERWLETGRKDTLAGTRELLTELEASYAPKPLPDELEKEVGKIVEQARLRLGGGRR
jgi:trimethylamine---corrinoid protein Co-methyltransferase